MRFKSASNSWNLASLSPGKPVITVVRIVTSGMTSRNTSAAQRDCSIARLRFIFSRTAGTVC